MKKKKTAPNKLPDKPVYPAVLETFRDLDLRDLTYTYGLDEPSSWNGYVRVHRYRITVELIDEPKEVLIARLEKLWVECDNTHHYGPLEAAARALGHVLTNNTFGSKRKKK